MLNCIDNVTTLDELFTAWQEKHKFKRENKFIVDGIVNKERWDAASIKICFLLKECYFDSEEYERDLHIPNQNVEKHHWNSYIVNRGGHYIYNLAKHLKDHTPWMMWCKVNQWMKRIYSILGEVEDNPIQSIAIVNIKKSEGRPQSNYQDILNYAHDDQCLIRKELEIINPDLVICGNTYDFCVKERLFDDIHEITTLTNFAHRKIACSGKTILFDCYHPSARVSYDKIESFFCEALQYYR